MGQARILRVVIASPGDVKGERESIPSVVEEVNRNIAHPRGLHLDLYRWETDAYPGFHPEGPQGLIDPQLKIESSDILIGIFWRRFGTPVNDANSGTEHEFRIAYEAWKRNSKPQIMVYFSQRSYTPKSKEETDQWGLVLQFKKDFPREGLWWDYRNKAEFERLTRNHLTQFVSSQSPLAPWLEPTVLAPRFQLPPPPADFTGRETELRDLRAYVEIGGVHISGLQGQGGIGKTALALKLAADLAPKFPDAQIYLDLKGASDKPLTAAEALSHVVRTFHPEAKLPEKEDDLCALFRSVLHDKRALLLMDNAKDAAQVNLIIPPVGSALLVTSRFHFTLPGLQQENIATLPPEDAVKLLLRIAPRIADEAGAIAKLCGYLALALRLAATAIAEHVDLVPADYRKKIADERTRLKMLIPTENGTDLSVEASISLSYKMLDVRSQEFWRMLAVFPDSFDSAAAAAVWEEQIETAQATLSDLLRCSMLEWNEGTRRYRLHDLMKSFAFQECTEAESAATALKHARHYLAVLSRIDGGLSGTADEIAARSLALFDLERENIQAGQVWASAHSARNSEAARLCGGFSDAGSYVLSMRLHPREGINWGEAGLTAARQLKDRAAEGRRLANLGVAYKNLGEFRRAIEYHEQRLAIARTIADRRGEGAGLANLGIAYSCLGDYRRAVDLFETSLGIARELGLRRWEGGVLGDLANVCRSLGEFRRAIEYFEQQLAIARETHNRRGEGNALGGLGTVYGDLGDHKRAIEYHQQHLVLAREIGFKLGESNALCNLAAAYTSLGDPSRGANLCEQALDLAREIGDRQGEGAALFNKSVAQDFLGDRKQAIEQAEAALRICEEIESPLAATVRKQLDIWRNR